MTALDQNFHTEFATSVLVWIWYGRMIHLSSQHLLSQQCFALQIQQQATSLLLFKQPHIRNAIQITFSRILFIAPGTLHSNKFHPRSIVQGHMNIAKYGLHANEYNYTMDHDHSYYINEYKIHSNCNVIVHDEHLFIHSNC